MRIVNAASGRFAFYDRNGVTLNNTYSQASIAPLGLTSRWSYTVPAARKFQFGFAQVSAVRATVAAPAGLVQAILYITPTGFTANIVLSARLYGNTIDAKTIVTGGSGFILSAGDVIQAYTQDASSSGLIDYDLTAPGIEFDA